MPKIDGPFLEFDRAEWARLRADLPLPLTDADLDRIRGVGDPISVDEVEAVYQPLTRWIDLRFEAARDFAERAGAFLDHPDRVPFLIGLAGSVAVGKSTIARLLRLLLARWPGHPQVQIVTTDGFLLPNAELVARGLMERKGFPESYDQRRLLDFVAAVKAGEVAEAPVYSHLVYDVVPGERIVVDRPDILILEGLNVLATGPVPPPRGFVSDYFDLSIFVDADERWIEEWYVDRFLTLRRTAFQDPASYFHRYASLSDEEAEATARWIWRTINLVNLREHIAPTRARADVVLSKGPDHGVDRIRLRRF